MKPKIFNPAIALIVICLAASSISFAQEVPAKPVAPDDSADQIVTVTTNTSVNASSPVDVRVVKVNLRKLKTQLKQYTAQANTQIVAAVNSLSTEIAANIDDVAPQINTAFNDADVNVTVNTKDNNNIDDADLVKNYSKTYPADANDVLSIENKYGSVTVNTWNRNEFKVDVQIKVTAGSEDRAQKILDDVNVSDAKNGSLVAFRTIIEQVKNSWFSAFTGGETRKVEIDYTVYMPAKNELVIDNHYGAINLPDLDGKVTIDCAYGGLKARSLSNESTIRLKYGNASIESLGDCTMQLSYGGLTVGSVNTLTADVNYSSGPVKIGKLHTSAAINLRYGGGLQIGDLDRNVKNLAINSSYSNIDIGLSGDENADFAIVTRYGDFNYDDHAFTITAKTPDDGEKGYHSTKSYKGYIGRANSGKTITINSSYGNVKFK